MIERTAKNDETYRAIRAELQFELGLINARVNWLVTSQAFLFVPLTIGAGGRPIADSLFYPLVPLLGIVLCLLVLVSISAALWRSRQWRAKCRGTAYEDELSRREFSIVPPSTAPIPFLGMVGAIGVPVVLTATWTWLLLEPPEFAV